MVLFSFADVSSFFNASWVLASLGVLGVLATLKIGSRAGVAAARALPDEIDLHTGSEILDKAGEILSKAVLHELKAELTGPLLDQVLEMAASGNVVNLERLIFREGFGMIDDIFSHLGPELGTLVAKTLGSGIRGKIQSLIVSNAIPVAVENAKELASLKTVTTLADGRKLVSVAMPQPPELQPVVEVAYVAPVEQKS